MRPDILYPLKRKELGTLAAGLVMTAASVFILWAGAGGLWISRIVGGVGLAFFGLATLVVFVRLLRPQPVLVIDGDGLQLAASRFGQLRVRWDEIDHLVIRRIAGQRMLGIIPREPAGRELGALARANLAFGAPFWVPESILPGRCEDVVDRMRRYHPVELRLDA